MEQVCTDKVRKQSLDREKPSRTANQLESNRALRNVQSLHEKLKMPVPQLPAVLAYLRWLDKMEAWHGKRHPSTVHEVSAKLRDTEDLYSWGGDFGSPIVLPRIKKHPNPEKFQSAQVKRNFNVGTDNYTTSATKAHAQTKRQVSKSTCDSRKRPEWYKPGAWELTGKKEKQVSIIEPEKRSKSRSKTAWTKKPTAFYIHAMNGFKYWPVELYQPPVPATKYSFGDRFNPGRAGVINDRIYARPRANKHYWTEFQQHQNPIGSGNVVTGSVLRN